MSVPGRSSAPGVRVATLNLWGRSGAWADRRRVLVEGLRALRPDLVAFQEAVRTGDYDQTMDLLGPGYQVVHQSERAADESGASIASRWPLGEVHEVDLHVTPRTADFPCTTLAAEVLAPAPLGPLLFVNHKPSWKWGLEHERELQAVAAARFVEELVARDRRHVILVGDQDAVPEAASMRFWRGLQSLHGSSVAYQDAWEAVHPGEPGHTFTPRTTRWSRRSNTRWRSRASCRWSRAGGSTTSSCAATTTGRCSTSPTAGASSTSRWTASGPATTSACWRTSPCRAASHQIAKR